MAHRSPTKYDDGNWERDYREEMLLEELEQEAWEEEQKANFFAAVKLDPDEYDLAVQIDIVNGLRPEKATMENHRHLQFINDMIEAGYEVDPAYYGRGEYVGPAVRCDRYEEDTVRNATKVGLTRDAMGMGIILYPK